MKEYQFDSDELLKDVLSIDKLEVARRHLITAIKMFFYDWDVVSLHLIVASAHQILDDISVHRGKKYSIKQTKLIQEMERKDFIKGINIPQNFFKHANKDPDSQIRFPYRMTPFLLFDAVRMYILLTGNTESYENKVFLLWFQLRYPDLFTFPNAEEELCKIRNTAKSERGFILLCRHLMQESEFQETNKLQAEQSGAANPLQPAASGDS
jgi:hypothetical protein